MPGTNQAPSEAKIIADLRRQVTRLGQTLARLLLENVNTITASGSALTLPDANVATMHDITLTANCTLTFPTARAGQSFSLRLKQDGTGSRTVTWPASVKWDSGTAPTLSTAANAIDAFAFVSFDGTRWEGFFSAKGLA